MNILTRLNRMRIYNPSTHTYDVYPVFTREEGIHPLQELLLKARLVSTRGALAHFRAQEPVFIARLLRRCTFYNVFIFLFWWYLLIVFC